MRENAARVAVVLTVLTLGLALGGSSVAQSEQDQQQDHAHMNVKHAPDGSGSDDTAIFCPTMKTGQLCTMGTTNVLQLKGEQRDQWAAMARKYNHAVNTATLQLFKDSEGVLNPEQQRLLKAWFAVGLNPQINQLLYSKGLGPQKP